MDKYYVRYIDESGKVLGWIRSPENLLAICESTRLENRRPYDTYYFCYDFKSINEAKRQALRVWWYGINTLDGKSPSHYEIIRKSGFSVHKAKLTKPKFI